MSGTPPFIMTDIAHNSLFISNLERREGHCLLARGLPYYPLGVAMDARRGGSYGPRQGKDSCP